jgi:hypothetical protein
MNTIEVLTKARQLITPQGSWCQGHTQLLDEPHAYVIARCAIGAIQAIARHDHKAIYAAATALVEEGEVLRKYGACPFDDCSEELGLQPQENIYWVTHHNDHKGMTQAQVLAWFDRTIAELQHTDELRAKTIAILAKTLDVPVVVEAELELA